MNDNIVLDEKLEIKNAVTINGNGHSKNILFSFGDYK